MNQGMIFGMTGFDSNVRQGLRYYRTSVEDMATQKQRRGLLYAATGLTLFGSIIAARGLRRSQGSALAMYVAGSFLLGLESNVNPF